MTGLEQEMYRWNISDAREVIKEAKGLFPEERMSIGSQWPKVKNLQIN